GTPTVRSTFRRCCSPKMWQAPSARYRTASPVLRERTRNFGPRFPMWQGAQSERRHDQPSHLPEEAWIPPRQQLTASTKTTSNTLEAHTKLCLPAARNRRLFVALY